MENRKNTMNKSHKRGKHREVFENEHASGALRASIYFYNSGPYVRAYCELAYEQSQKQDETLRKNVKNRQ